MDFNISLHPQAQNYLFEHYRSVRFIFNDVLGHLEVDYISIALLNVKSELMLLSSRPAIEHNLIERHLWKDDPCLQQSFFLNNKIHIWNHVYQEPGRLYLKHYKLEKPKLSFAMSIPAKHDQFHVAYSFGVKTLDESVHIDLMNKTQTLSAIGRFCLQNILSELHLAFSDLSKQSHLKLISNSSNF